jgi:glucose-1-phosphate cytidylyltransferase
MKVIILAGGLGTRISEETTNKPKPMILLDDKPVLWHLMNIFAKQGLDDFIVAAGYAGEVIHQWNRNLRSSWKIQVIDTGLTTQTGGRIAQCMKLVPGERVIATYGDGLGNINIKSLLEFHKNHNHLATVTAVRPPARFGVLESINGLVTHFAEKNQVDAGWINGGFFVLEPDVANHIYSDQEPFETGALLRLVEKQQLMAFYHHDFWRPMDTLREKQILANFLKNGNPPWLEKLFT